jgi:hypothetical protein
MKNEIMRKETLFEVRFKPPPLKRCIELVEMGNKVG